MSIEAADEASLAVTPAQGARLLAADLLRALNGLPDDQRSVLLLVSVEDLSTAEAAVMKVPMGTVTSCL
ncbi:sigma factor-like helix-turn-helix DNA-binding protein [Sphingomonas nostoxanthinifaciens]|uniref:sigma factor-like helix-turn-helix DNA-binding protein n=1 Tax=Sphingomonas nostoxanthinifaciens TaxID=2872652 RepID=UPI001CC1D052|nr:sigma factor-like helix-turn-helix DNA-binding protein [Sphingomonas nostoxanthinifaciens]UAK25516.1 hypothetical protein K8P63_04960 [Sphingomonas nostoxanthinifaciens]